MTKWESIRCRLDGSCPASPKHPLAKSPLQGSVFLGTDHGLRLDAHSERKKRWEDHEQYLAGLTKVLGRVSEKRLIVVGDFNQAIGSGSRAPQKLRSALREAIPPGMTIVTSALAFQGRKCIDHIALSEDLAFSSLGVISNIHEEKKLSDHFGVVANLSALPSR